MHANSSILLIAYTVLRLRKRPLRAILGSICLKSVENFEKPRK